jgi:hypothetical protein
MYTGDICKRVFSFDHWAKELPPKTSFGHSGGGDEEEGGVSRSGGGQVQVLGTLASSKRSVVPPPLFAYPSCLASPFAGVAGVASVGPLASPFAAVAGVAGGAGVGPLGSRPAGPAREVDGIADDRRTAEGQKQEEGGVSRSQTQEEAPFAARSRNRLHLPATPATPAQVEWDLLSLGEEEQQQRENGRVIDGKLLPHYFVGEHMYVCIWMYVWMYVWMHI